MHVYSEPPKVKPTEVTWCLLIIIKFLTDYENLEQLSSGQWS